ncbi:MAG: flavodoxin [Candidatus Nanoarchaeia archaeon]|nr:flavodoxin [Candidatus Nanoarchaeia archaeon]
MKTLIVYYSKTGNTKKVAEELNKQIKADVEEIIDTKKRSGILGWILGGRDAVRNKLTKINPIKYNPEDYDLVLIGSPVWGFKVVPAIRTYLTENKFKQVAFFCTMDGSGDEGTFKSMEEISKKPIATLAVKSKELEQNILADKIKEFIEKWK